MARVYGLERPLRTAQPPKFVAPAKPVPRIPRGTTYHVPRISYLVARTSRRIARIYRDESPDESSSRFEIMPLISDRGRDRYATAARSLTPFDDDDESGGTGIVGIIYAITGAIRSSRQRLDRNGREVSIDVSARTLKRPPRRRSRR